jgi:hypothetical protein
MIAVAVPADMKLSPFLTALFLLIPSLFAEVGPACAA